MRHTNDRAIKIAAEEASVRRGCHSMGLGRQLSSFHRMIQGTSSQGAFSFNRAIITSQI